MLLSRTLNKKKGSSVEEYLGYKHNTWFWPSVLILTVFSTPDDGRRKRPKHVEYSCSD
jgi:hypothetical protein